MNRKFGFARVSACSPLVVVGDPRANLENIMRQLANTDVRESDVIVFPELCTTGYTCGDLFRQTLLLEKAEAAIEEIKNWSGKQGNGGQLIFVGAPIRVDTQLYNCAVAICDGEILGVVPKQNIPNYNEFYERRWFTAFKVGPKSIYFAGQQVLFGVDLLFKCGDLIVFAEICEDLWMPIPPSSLAALRGANLIVNLSASPETVGKDEYRGELIRNQSGRCIAAVAYASAGPSESTSDLVFGGHCVIAENGNILSESEHIGDGSLDFGERYTTADIDFQRLNTDRRVQGTFGEQMEMLHEAYRPVIWHAMEKQAGLERHVPAYPFIPSDPAKLAARCAAIFDIQCAGLAKRLKHLNYPDVHIGVSGGLDSTHALLVACKVFTTLNLPLTGIHAKTMPGFGTTKKTKSIALQLMSLLGVTQEEIDIRPSCFQTFQDLKHKPFGIPISNMGCGRFCEVLTELWPGIPADQRKDLVFENVQARRRTELLMDSGFVLGTGDLSELALGWCTYNGDHMSMYNVNCSVPKTLIKFLVKYVALNHYPEGTIRQVLLECAGLTISPELLPPGIDDKIDQSTEDQLGSYDLHDFYLLNFVRYGFSPEKILYLARHSDLAKKFTVDYRKETMKTFLKRFFSNQFKRDAVPDGPKVGSVSLSPRGDWRMPSDAAVSMWLETL
jgi:NAD+ synthase (glutamine-hydrolysing)